MNYDPSNIFSRIINKELPCRLVAETPHSLAFYDAFPRASLHVLIIPKGPYQAASDFFNDASPEEILDFFHLIGRLPRQLDIEKTGYRLVSNEGRDGGQEVPHFHVHLLAKQRFGSFVSCG